jgi:hypothetical protein
VLRGVLVMRSACCGALCALAVCCGAFGVGSGVAAAARPAHAARVCRSFRAGGFSVVAIRAHLATCSDVHHMVRNWARVHFRNTGPDVFELWGCSMDKIGARPPGAASCFAGLNGLVRFRLRR